MEPTIIIPAFNEETRLKFFLDRIAVYLQNHSKDIYELLVVDDGSQDATVTVAEGFREKIPQLKILRLGKNQGKGAAIRAGVMASKGDVIIFMDADGATDISELPKMLRGLSTHQIAVGNRWMKQAQTKRSSILRHVAGWTYRSYMRLFGLGEIDTMCGFKGYRREAARDLFQDLQEPRWLFDTEIAYKAILRGYSINNFPIAWEAKDGSKLSSSTLLATAFKILPLIMRIRRLEKHKISIHK